MTEQPIRPAATLILVRQGVAGPEVLMGQRGAGAVFMPSKYVFPGGAVDAGDADVPLAAGPEDAGCLEGASTLAAAAIRELWEETGLAHGTPGAWPGAVTPGWEGFAARGLRPTAAGLRFIFRAITPPGRPRRFDARFFLADAGRIAGDADDFSAASDELGHLHWIGLPEARGLDLPFITEVVLSEVAMILRGAKQPGVPFFDNSGPVPAFRRL